MYQKVVELSHFIKNKEAPFVWSSENWVSRLKMTRIKDGAKNVKKETQPKNRLKLSSLKPWMVFRCVVEWFHFY